MADALWLDEPFKSAWQGKDPFVEAEKLGGEVFRELDGRTTFRFDFQGESFFMKIHRGIGWREILKNLISLRLPILGATNEYRAIRKCTQVGVETMTAVGFGRRGSDPARQHSFVITRDLSNTISLEDLCKDWPENPPSDAMRVALVERVAVMARRLHGAGMNHRDFYLCHFLLNKNWLKDPQQHPLNLHLIDLHRVQFRDKVPFRWQVKDLGGLLFSAMDIGLTDRDRQLFVEAYTGLDQAQTCKKDARLWRAVQQNADKLYAKVQRKGHR
jgi:heptose I phosphotransferase